MLLKGRVIVLNINTVYRFTIAYSLIDQDIMEIRTLNQKTEYITYDKKEEIVEVIKAQTRILKRSQVPEICYDQQTKMPVSRNYIIDKQKLEELKGKDLFEINPEIEF